ncbi:MAG: substrate-binding domain-containing protein [Nitrospirae bacterium]|nr:substrate-binding domain-containing protein [Nitrospirota bacterium]
MKKTGFFIFSAVVFFSFVQTAHAEEKIRVAGSGSMISLVSELAKAFMTDNRNLVIEVNQKSIESTGGIMGAAQGQLEIGMASRPLKDDEKAMGVVASEISRVATVIGVNRSVAVKEITSDNLCKIYSGKATNWKQLGGGNENIMPLTRPDRDATKETVRKSVACFKDLKEPETVAIVATAPEMTKILANRPGTIGFTDSVAVDDSGGAIVALKLDGLLPSPEHVRDGRYRIIKSNFLITKGQPAGAAADFLKFIKGPKGTKIIEANKAVAVK